MNRRVVPGRHDLAGLALRRVPGGRDVSVDAPEHDDASARPAASRQNGLARATCARNTPSPGGAAWRRNGTELAVSPAAPCVTSRPSGLESISACLPKHPRMAGGSMTSGAPVNPATAACGPAPWALPRWARRRAARAAPAAASSPAAPRICRCRPRGCGG